MSSAYPTSASAPPFTGRLTQRSRRVAFAAIAAFIMLGPAPGQLFGLHSIALREWVMFSGAGVGLPKGQFTLHRGDRAVTLSPLEVAGRSSYLDLPFDRRIYEPADLRAFAAPICEGRRPARLSFKGHVATFTGWRALAADDICNAPAQAHFEDESP